MHRNRLFLFLGLLLLRCLFPTTVTAATAPNVIISEVAWAGSSTSSADEWIELANVSDEQKDISGWSLSGASTQPLVFPSGSVIAPHKTFLIANYDTSNTNTLLNTSAQMVTSLVSIPNDKLAITLTSPDRGVVDTAGNGGAPLAGRSGGTGTSSDGIYRSMERINAFVDGTNKDAWTDATTSSDLKPGALDLGTPGTFSSSLLPPTVAANSSDPISDSNSLTTQTTADSENVCEDVMAENVSNAITTDATPPSSPPSTIVPVAQNTPTTTSKGTLMISEIYSHPSTEEPEWVELKNTSMYPVVINGWSLVDASNAATTLPDGIVSPGSFLVIENPKGKLNNDGDSLFVKDQTGELIDTAVYSIDTGTVPNTNESLIRTKPTVLTLTTTPTKNAENSLTPRAEKTEPLSATNTNTGAQTNLPVTPVATEPTPKGSYQNWFRLSEIYPNTNGNDATDEFIEIENVRDVDTSLAGWKLTDASGASYTFTNETKLLANSLHAFFRPETKLSLNNDGDTVTLLAPDGSVVDTLIYEQAKADLTYARTNGVWNWTTTRTPNEPNLFSPSSPSLPTTTPVSSKTQSTIRTSTSSLLTIEQAKDRADGEQVRVRGMVTATPNTFTSQTMYLQDETGGIQIYKQDCRFPNVTEGQLITVMGTLSHINGEARIRVSNKATLVVGATVGSPTPNTLTTTDESAIGQLVTIAGKITSRSGNRLTVATNNESIRVDLPKNTSVALYQKGANIQASGILSKSSSGMMIKARSENDLSLGGTVSADTSTSNIQTATSPNQLVALVLVILSSLAFIGLKLRSALYVRNQPRRHAASIARS